MRCDGEMCIGVEDTKRLNSERREEAKGRKSGRERKWL